MALQTSGAISFSQIAAHFGGSGSHSLSEYHALAGKGVSGIPASGSISFSHFHGKSNQVTTSVWVSSGYNQTTFGHIQTYNADSSYQTYWAQRFDRGYYMIRLHGVSYHYSNVHNFRATWINGKRYTHGAYDGRLSGNTWFYDLVEYGDITTWVDTSGYQNQTTTAQIST